MEVSNSCRGYPGYKNYRPFEIKLMRRIARLGYRRGRLGEWRWSVMIYPFAIFQFWMSVWYYAVYRRNVQYTMDEQREIQARLYPLYKHAEEKEYVHVNAFIIW